MPSISDYYTDEVYKHLRPLHANWEPGKPVELGHVGLIDDHKFEHKGNLLDIIKETGETVDLEVVKDDERDQKLFASEDACKFKIYAKGGVDINGTVCANAGIDVEFTSQKGAFFNASECVHDMYANKIKIEKIILKLLEGGLWDKRWAIVTDIVHAGATTVIVSGGKKASIKLEAGADIEQIDLADASIGLNISHMENVGYHEVTAVGMTPLIGLSKIKKRFLGPNELTPLMKRAPSMRSVSDIDDIEIGEDLESLYLAQIE
ncbi:MAG: hypothetical protein JSW52_10825 [Candidatus Coatesbacteria bacterium]|nr:MAG: hypothetical protein JSW52_10825 [Candidatus Coatesbacteria bacterium]